MNPINGCDRKKWVCLFIKLPYLELLSNFYQVTNQPTTVKDPVRQVLETPSLFVLEYT